MTLRALLTRLVLYCVLPLGALAVWLAWDRVSSVQEDREREAQDRVGNAMHLVDRFLEAHVHGLQVLASSPLLGEPTRWEDFRTEALGFRSTFGSHVILAEPGGRMLLNTRTPAGESLPMLPRPRGHAAVPEVLATGRPSIGDVFPGPIAREPLFAIVVPVVQRGRITHLLLGTVETHAVQERLAAVALPPAWILHLRDSKGELVASRPPETASALADRESDYHFRAASALTPWTLELRIRKDEYRAPIVGASLAILVAVLGTALASLGGGLYASRRLARAVTTLAEGGPAPGAVPTIAEFEAVRRSLTAKDAARDRAEAALQESEYRFRTLVQAVPNIAVQGYDRERRVIFWNSASEALYGFTSEEALGRRLEELIIPPGMADEVVRAISEWIDKGPPIPAGELVLRRKNGSPASVYSSHAMLVNHEGDPEMFCIDVDLAPLRRAEAQAIAWRSRYLAAIRASGQILHEWSPSSGEMTVQGDMERILGYGPEEMAGGLARWRELIHPEDLPGFDRDLARAIAGREPFHHQYRVRRKDGEWLTMRDDGYFVLDDTEEIACMVCFVADETERVRSRRQIESQLEELQRWHRVTLGREKRIGELKAEVNALRHRLGEPALYGPPDTGATT